MRLLIRKFTTVEIELLKSCRGLHTFEDDYEIMRANEVPHAATLLVEGEICVLKNEEEFLRITPGYLVGLREMYFNQPSRVRCRAKKNSKVIILSHLDMYETAPVHAILKGFC